MIFLLGVVTVILASTASTAHAADADPYNIILKKIDALSLGMTDSLQADMRDNWDAVYSKRYSVTSTMNSIDRLGEIYQQRQYPQITDSIRSLGASIRNANTVDQIMGYRDDIAKLEESVEVLDNSNDVERMLLLHEDVSDLKTYLHGIWTPIHANINDSRTADDVLSFQTDVENMEQTIRYTLSIYENTHSPVFTIIDPHIKSVWNSFRYEVPNTESLEDLTKVTAQYYHKVGKIDGKIISRWDAKITELQVHAGRQGNVRDLMLIENNIKTLDMVKHLEKNTKSFDDTQSKAILKNISQNYIKIKSDLKEYDLYLDGKNQMTQKVTRLLHMANDKSNVNKMPEFESKIKNTLNSVSHIKNVLKTNDFRYAQQLLGALEQQWLNFERFYPEIRSYTPTYEQQDLSTAQKKQFYLKQISQISSLVKSLNLNQASSDYMQYKKSLQESKASILYGNFQTGHEKIYKTIDFVGQKFLPHDPRIIMNTSYDDSNMFTVAGAVYKHHMNSRDPVSFYLFNHDGQIVKFDSRTARSGDFQMLWRADIQPGLYIAEIQHGSARESQIISISDGHHEMVFNQDEIAMMEVANTFENLEGFVDRFGSSGSRGMEKMQLVINKIRGDLTSGQLDTAAASVQKFKNNIKLYMPIQSSGINIDASQTDSTVRVTGNIAKTVEYREQIFLTVFDHDGKRVYEQITYDDKYGNINIEMPKHALAGLAVIQVEYHDSLARDIIEINQNP